jgi:hypothetical protein
MRRALALLVLLAAPACLGTSPEEEARAAQGEDDDGDEEHRPGQPCLTCHGESYAPGDDVFVVAGTIYLLPGDEDGLRGARIDMVDAVGHEFTAVSNRVGNFMVEVRSGLGSPRQREHGRLEIPWDPVFPLEVTVSHGNDVQEMESYIWRDGSCAGCHTGPDDGTKSVARVYAAEDGN